MNLRITMLGLLFGFVLVRSGATDFDAITNMFLLEDLHLAGVIAVAVAMLAPTFIWLRRARIVGGAGCDRPLVRKPVKTGLVLGGLLFGFGWGLTGTCPGTALAQLGEGRLVAFFTIAGIFGGTALYRRYGPQLERGLQRIRPPA